MKTESELCFASTCRARPRFGLPIALLTSLLIASGIAEATVVYCVSTAQELQNALTKSSDGGVNNGKDNHIHIVKGTYAAATTSPPGTFYYVNTAATGDLVIEGGYDSGCNTRSPNPLLTLLDGNYTYQVMSLESYAGEIDISGVTIQDGESTLDGGGLLVNPSANDKSTVDIFDNIVRSNHTSAFGGGIAASADGSSHFVFLTNNLIVGNSADNGTGGAELIGNGSGVLIYDNTVYQNTTTSPSANAIGGIDCGGSGECEVNNNIIWGNTNIGITVRAAGIKTLDYNDIGNYTGGPFDENLGNQSVAPKFVDATGGNFHLASNSSLLGVSPILFGVPDLDGNAYPTHGVQDMGAYEETIFTNGFDVPPPK